MFCFACEYLVFPTPFIEEIILPPLTDLVNGSLVKYQLAICVRAFNFVPLVYVSVFMPAPYCFDYHSFII